MHFFFPKDYAWAANDSATNFAGRTSVKRYFYSDRGKDYMLVGVPYSWITGSPTGTLIIDPAPTVATSEDVWLENTSNFDGNSVGLLIGKAADPYPKKRTIIKFNIAGYFPPPPNNVTVLNAQMKLYYYSAANGGSGSWVDRWVQAHQILMSWNETQATSVNRLSGTPWNVAYVGLNDIDAKSSFESTVLFQQSQYPIWKAWNLTNLTQKWVNGTATNYGVVLWATNETTNGYDLRFHSSDAPPPNNANPPTLEVTYSTEAKTVYFLKDHLGSIRATVLDTATAPVRGYDDYDPWGYILAGRSMLTSGWSSNAGIVKNKFTGKEWDDDYSLNWNYFGARYYDPQIGRWMVRDPLADDYAGWSPYNYTLNNPINLIDRKGLAPDDYYYDEQGELLKIEEKSWLHNTIVGDRKYIASENGDFELVDGGAVANLIDIAGLENVPKLGEVINENVDAVMVSVSGNISEDVLTKGGVGAEVAVFIGTDGSSALGGYLSYPKYEGGAVIPMNAGAGININVGILTTSGIWHGLSIGVAGKSIVPAGFSHHKTWYVGGGVGNQGLIDSYKEGFNQYPVTIGPVGVGYFNSLPLR